MYQKEIHHLNGPNINKHQIVNPNIRIMNNPNNIQLTTATPVRQNEVFRS